LAPLQHQGAEHERWVDRHPEAARRINQLGTEIEVLDARLQRGRGTRKSDRARPASPVAWPAVVQERDFGIDL
jgi:hypothetical protein